MELKWYGKCLAVRVYPANGSVPIAEKLLHLAGAAAVASMLPEVRRAIDPRRRYGARGRGLVVEWSLSTPGPGCNANAGVQLKLRVKCQQLANAAGGLVCSLLDGSRFPDRK
jgi:hypothetical protein